MVRGLLVCCYNCCSEKLHCSDPLPGDHIALVASDSQGPPLHTILNELRARGIHAKSLSRLQV
jgi:hypothetical protein